MKSSYGETTSFKVTFAGERAWFRVKRESFAENVDSPESLDEGTIGTLKLGC